MTDNKHNKTSRQVLFIFCQTEYKANGGINSLFQIITNLKNVTPVVLTQKDSVINDQLKSLGIRIIVMNGIDSSNILSKILSWIKFQFYLSKILVRNNFCAIHINDIQSLLYSIFLCRLFMHKVIFNLRGVFEPDKKYGLKWAIINGCSKIIVLSQEMKEQLSKRLPIWFFKEKNRFLVFIYSIVDFTRFNNRSKVHDSKNFKILYSAIFSDLKNQYNFLINSIDWINDNDVEVNFIGDVNNDYGKRCKKLVKDTQISEKVKFHNYQKDVEKFYQEADVTVVASRREGLARCMIESMACGTPVISFDVCSANEILSTHKCGKVVKQGNYEELISELEEFMKSKELRSQYSFNAHNTATQLFSKAHIIAQYEKLYLE